jgi:tetratricopeptide (TPR) repeat protein
MRGRGFGHALWIVTLGMVLAPPEPPPLSTSTSAPAIVDEQRLVETLFVDVHKPVELPVGRRIPEAVGHVLLYVETFLADLPGVVPRVDGVPLNPGLAQALPPETGGWTLGVAVQVVEDAVGVDLQLCDPAGACETLHGDGVRMTPNQTVGNLIAEVGRRLGREPSVPIEAWTSPLTRDDYAVLMAGRSAAILYGYMPPVAPEAQGDSRRDPVARAVFLDPRLVASWTVVARSTTDPGKQILAWKFGSDGFPRSAALKAGHAASLDAEGLVEPAWSAWSSVATLAPTDLRFLVPRARAALRVGQMKEAERILALVPARYGGDPLIAMMNVAVADARGGASDPLLERWQTSDVNNPEPVRRRITLAINGDRFSDALELTPELARRGAVEEAASLTVALASDLGRFGQAAQAAQTLQQPELAARLSARAQDDATARAETLLRVTDPAGRLARAEALLQARKGAEARAEAEKLLKDRPWWPEALDLHARALAALGQEKAAAESASKVLYADPLFHETHRKVQAPELRP